MSVIFYPALTASGGSGTVVGPLSGAVTTPNAASGVTTLSAGVVTPTNLDTALAKTAYDSWIGSSLTRPSAEVTSSAGVVTLTFQNDPTGDIGLIFSTGITTVDCTPALTIALTQGSDASPQVNYVYIRLAAPTVLTLSTTGFPTAEEFYPIGKYMVPTAATVATYGLVQEHRRYDYPWNDTTEVGHINHINARLRRAPAVWISGALCTPTLTGAASPDTLTIAVAAGVVLQIEDTAFTAFDSSVAGTTNLDTFFVINHTTPYTVGKDLYNFRVTSGGAAVSNGNRISWVVWGSVDKANNQRVFINLPSGFYGSNAAAIADDSRFTNYTIPAEYSSTGFLIAKLTYTYTFGAGGTLTLVENIDLRGQSPTVVAGGTAIGQTKFPDNVFAVQDVSDPTKQILFDVSGTLGTALTLASAQTSNKTITFPDAAGTVALTTAIATTGADLSWSAAGGLAVPDAGVGVRGVITAAAQTIAGAKTFTSPILEAAGTAALPAYSFSTDANTGIYNSAADELDLSTGGVNRVAVRSTGRVNIGGNLALDNQQLLVTPTVTTIAALGLRAMAAQTSRALEIANSTGTILSGIIVTGEFTAPNGSASAPAYSFLSDTNTGIYSSTADELDLSTGGVNRVAVRATGNVVIGGNLTTDTNQVLVTSTATTKPTLGLRAIASQTASLLEAQNSSGTVLGKMINSGELQLPQGGAGVPTYSFIGNTNTGMYSGGGGLLGFSANSSEIMVLESTGNILTAKIHNNASSFGTVNDPEIRSHAGDGVSVSSTTNLAFSPTASKPNVIRVGNVVTVSGMFTEVSPTSPNAATEIILGMNISSPIPSIDNLCGVGVLLNDGSKVTEPVFVVSDTGGRVALRWWAMYGDTGQTMTYHFTYEVT